MIFRNDHFFLASASDIREIIQPLRSLGITYFGYSRYYYDGGRLWLCTHPENIESYYNTKRYQIGNTEAHPRTYSAQVALWSTLPNQQVFEDSKQLGIDHGVFIFEPQKDSCEIFSFATTPDNYNIVNTYLTNIEFLKNFNNYFKKVAQRIIKTGEKNKLYFPYHNNTLPLQHSIDPSTVLSQELKSKLTHRQFTCAKLLVQGYTIREIAALQNLSPRTIETYINNIKSKLNCRNKSELIAKLIANYPNILLLS